MAKQLGNRSLPLRTSSHYVLDLVFALIMTRAREWH